MTKLVCGSCKLYYYKQIELVIKSLLNYSLFLKSVSELKTVVGKKTVSEFIALKTKLFIACKHWDDSTRKPDEIDKCRFCKTRMLIFGFEGKMPKTKSALLNPAAFRQIVFEFPGVVKMLRFKGYKTVYKQDAKKPSTASETGKIVAMKEFVSTSSFNQELLSTQLSRVCDSRNCIKIIDKINQIFFSVHRNEETIPFLKNSVSERFRLTCPITARA